MSQTLAGQQQVITFSEGELLSLKELSTEARKRWWTDYPFLVSLLAFTLSLATSLGSAYESHKRDLHDQQSQLASALGSLQELNVKLVESHEKYQNTPYESQVTGLITAQVNSTLQIAAGLAAQLGANATTGELVAVGQGLFHVRDNISSEKILKYALAAAANAYDSSVALRFLGNLKARTGRGGVALAEAEKYFNRALELDREYDLFAQPLSIMWLRATAHLDWADAVASFDCATAQKYF